GEHAEEEFFAHGGQKTAEQDEGPGESGVQQVRVRHVGRRPCAVTVSHNVEPGLVGDEDPGQGDAEDGTQEKAWGARAARREEFTKRILVTELWAVAPWGARCEDEQQAARAQGREQ